MQEYKLRLKSFPCVCMFSLRCLKDDLICVQERKCPIEKLDIKHDMKVINKFSQLENEIHSVQMKTGDTNENLIYL